MCVCVCERERDREGETNHGEQILLGKWFEIGFTHASVLMRVGAPRLLAPKWFVALLYYLRWPGRRGGVSGRRGGNRLEDVEGRK